MGILVTGIGPRCGTSNMTKQVIDAGYELVGTQFPAHAAPELNPEGYWEPEIEQIWDGIDISGNKVVKVFPFSIRQVSGIDRIICMHRDRKSQMASIMRCQEYEDMGLQESIMHDVLNKQEKIIKDLEKTIPVHHYEMGMKLEI